MRWFGPYRWQVNLDSVPDYLAESGPPSGPPSVAPSGPSSDPPSDPSSASDRVLSAILRAANAVSSGANDCGLPEFTTVRQEYSGPTSRTAAVTEDGRCGSRDGRNVVSFGPLPAGLLAVTCVWWEGSRGNQHTVEADIRIDATGGAFFLTQPADCQARWDLEGILSHEFGHVLGLGHVAFGQHSALTMSDGLPDCTTAYRGLGLGDYLALRAHYAPGG